MSQHQLPYGNTFLPLELPDEYRVDWIEPAYTPPAENPLEVIRGAIQNPADGKRLRDYRPARSAAIAINDKTRPVPNEYLLPPLLDELHEAGLEKKDIRFIIATGTHLPIQREEFDRILPAEISGHYPVISHDCDQQDNLIFLGQTSRGTEAWVNRLYYESDLRITVGNIEPHHFAGFSGGSKTSAIGLGGRKTINHNHSLLVDPNSFIAQYDQNPLRQDIEELGGMIGKQFSLNAILNGDKKIVQAVSGEPLAVMRAGIPISRQVCQIEIKGLYDLVIASPGGAPKDINFYQAQKAITHASMFARDGGVILLVSACPEGTGSRAYEEFMTGLSSPEEVFAKFRAQGFRVGPHKAFQVARQASRVTLLLLSEIPAELVSKLLMTPVSSLNRGVETAFSLLSPTPPADLRIAVLPHATNTIPNR